MTPQEISTAYGRSLVRNHLSCFDLVFSAGPSCRCAFHVRRLFNQEEAFPFDWWLTPASSVLQMLQPDYRFALRASDVHLTQAGQVVLNSRDLLLHLHDFQRTDAGTISLERLDDQLRKINAKYTFLFERLRERLRTAQRCLVILEGLMPAAALESHRQRTTCPALSYPELSPAFASNLVALFGEAYGVETTLASFNLGPPAIVEHTNMLQITTPWLDAPFGTDAEPWQRPWASYDLFIAQLCAAIQPASRSHQ